jgi:hypothetical protein
MAKRGRKPIEINLKEVQTLAAQGLTDEKIYDFLGISHQTFYKRKREMVEFNEALSQGRARGEAALANKLYQKAVNGSSEDIKYILERRYGWGKVDKIEVGGTVKQDHEHKQTYEIGPALREVLESIGIPAGPAGPEDRDAGDRQE